MSKLSCGNLFSNLQKKKCFIMIGVYIHDNMSCCALLSIGGGQTPFVWTQDCRLVIKEGNNLMCQEGKKRNAAAIRHVNCMHVYICLYDRWACCLLKWRCLLTMCMCCVLPSQHLNDIKALCKLSPWQLFRIPSPLSV